MHSTVDVSRRQDLAAFLRARRNSVRPEDVGIEDLAGRHVRGLRRKEVAALAGISTTWYTWIEQGREISISPDALERIGRALRLTPRHVEYMNVLLRPPQGRAAHPTPEIPQALRELVLSTTAPAYVATPRFDLLVWNDFVSDVFGYDAGSAPLARNILWRMFFDPARRQLYVDWEQSASMAVANFRHIFAYYRENPEFEALLDELLRSEDFARMWERWDVLAPADTTPFLIRHRTRGLCELVPVQASFDAAPGCYLVVFSCTQRS